MANGAKLFEVIYTDTQEAVPVLVGIGDTIRATAWAEKEYAFPPKPDLSADLTEAELEFNREEYRDAKFAVLQQRENHGGLYAVYLGAKRGHLRGVDDGDWVDWLAMVTMPDDDEPAQEPPRGGIQRAIERSLARVALDSLQPVGDLCDLLGVPRYRPGVFHAMVELLYGGDGESGESAREARLSALGHRLTRGR